VDIQKESKNKFSKKGIAIIASVLIAAILGFVYFAFLQNNDTGFVRPNSDLKGQTTRLYAGQDGIDISDDVKVESKKLEEQERINAGKTETTRIPEIPVDKKPISVDVLDGKSLQELALIDVPCIDSEYDKDGYHCETGFDKQGYDKDGYDVNGFNKNGCNSKGLDRRGEPCKNKNIFSET